MSLTYIEWVWPHAFWLILLPPLLFLIPKKSRATTDALYFPMAQKLKSDLTAPTRTSSVFFRNGYWWLIWSLLCIALARPILLGEIIELPREGRNILIAVDISTSMRKADMVLNNRRVDRLTMVKAVVDDFIQKRNNDKLGLILFGTQAFLHSPLTYDLETVRQLLSESIIGLAGSNTAIGDAIGLAVKHSEKFTGEKVLILLTDGNNTAGKTDPITASQYAKIADLTIYAVGIGRPSWLNQGIDMSTLNQIANESGGKAFQVESTQELQRFYHLINRIVPNTDKDHSLRQNTSYYWLPLLISALLLLIALIFTNLRSIFSQKATR